MISVYEDYLPLPMSLSMEEMAALHREMADEAGTDSDALELYGEVVEAAMKYMRYRSSWLLWDREQKADNDAARTSCHNMLIIKINQFARYLKMQGKAAAWRDVLGQEDENPYCRKRIGDFACYLVWVNSLLAR